MGRVLAIDNGSRRIGIALSDPLRIIAQSFRTVYRNQRDPERAVCEIAEIVSENDVDEIVIGAPNRTDGKCGESLRLAEELGALLYEKTGIQPKYLDERYTTVIASRYLIETGASREKRKAVIDQMAAQVILREYLDNLRSSEN
ncbi:MAG: Holliday junction resolvase RuvX [Clostridiaceae bacterium]|mgnify:CR=1 FL=1|nr:Holliday junction resolvase RuvX [Clostridiaceae bacterium]